MAAAADAAAVAAAAAVAVAAAAAAVVGINEWHACTINTHFASSSQATYRNSQ